MIPLGLPGTFVQVAAAAVLALATGGVPIGWTWVAAFLALALAGEAIEFLSGQWGARRFGGSRAAAWGALAGGLLGAVVGGIPVPVAGSVVASFLGTFAGALAGQMWSRRSLRPEMRVGLGALVGRAVATSVKLGIGCTILVLSAAVLLRARLG